MKRNQWQTVIDKFHQSGLTKRAFADQHNVVYSQLLYWIRQFEGKTDESTPKGDGLVPVIVKPESAKPKQDVILGVIEFPNGACLKIHSPDLLLMLPALLQG